jgi:hypothetical protein
MRGAVVVTSSHRNWKWIQPGVAVGFGDFGNALISKPVVTLAALNR